MDIFKLAEDNIDRFKNILANLNKRYEQFNYFSSRRELTNIEHFYIVLYIIYLKPDLIFESGYFKGRTSTILLESLREFDINCKYYVANINRKEHIYFLKDYDNFTVLSGMAQDVIKKIPESGVKAVASIDSPKFKKYNISSDTYNQLIEKFKMLAIFQHDINKEPDITNYNRYYRKNKLNAKFKKLLLKQDFLDKYVFLDNRVFPAESLGVLIKK